MKSSSRRTFFQQAAAGLGMLSLAPSGLGAGDGGGSKMLKVAIIK